MQLTRTAKSDSSGNRNCEVAPDPGPARDRVFYCASRVNPTCGPGNRAVFFHARMEGSSLITLQVQPGKRPRLACRHNCGALYPTVLSMEAAAGPRRTSSTPRLPVHFLLLA